jgi:hypothetical protein
MDLQSVVLPCGWYLSYVFEVRSNNPRSINQIRLTFCKESRELPKVHWKGVWNSEQEISHAVVWFEILRKGWNIFYVVKCAIIYHNMMVKEQMNSGEIECEENYMDLSTFHPLWEGEDDNEQPSNEQPPQASDLCIMLDNSFKYTCVAKKWNEIWHWWCNPTTRFTEETF